MKNRVSVTRVLLGVIAVSLCFSVLPALFSSRVEQWCCFGLLGLVVVLALVVGCLALLIWRIHQDRKTASPDWVSWISLCVLLLSAVVLTSFWFLWWVTEGGLGRDWFVLPAYVAIASYLVLLVRLEQREPGRRIFGLPLSLLLASLAAELFLFCVWTRGKMLWVLLAMGLGVLVAVGCILAMDRMGLSGPRPARRKALVFMLIVSLTGLVGLAFSGPTGRLQVMIQYRAGRRDFRYADLVHADLHGVNLHQADLHNANLHDADLRGADLSEADLSEADLWDADLSEADLQGADLTAARLWKANLHRADLSGANLSQTNLQGADLSAATVTDAQLANAASLKGAIIPAGLAHKPMAAFPPAVPTPAPPVPEAMRQLAPGWTSYMTEGELRENLEPGAVVVGGFWSDIAVASDGALWFVTLGGGVLRFDGETWTAYSEDDGLPSNIGLSSTADRGPLGGTSSRQWFATAEGICRFDGQTWTSYPESAHLAGGPGPTAMAPDGALWYGTAKGATRFDGEDWITYTAADGLASNYVLDIVVGSDGATWFATNGGVSRFDGGLWTTYTTAHGLAYNRVAAIALAPDGALWFGTGDGVSRFDGETWTTYTTADGLVNNDVGAVAVAPDGALWFGTAGGVSRFDGWTWTSYTTADGLAHDTVSVVQVAPDGAVWFGTEGGLSRYMPPGP